MMKAVLFLLLAAVCTADDHCDDFFAIRCTKAFVDGGCDFGKGAPMGMGFSCTPYFPCAVTACDLDQFYTGTSLPDEPPSFLGDRKMMPVGMTTVHKTKTVISMLLVIGKNIAVTPFLAMTVGDVFKMMIPKGVSATTSVVFTKKTVFAVETKAIGSTPADTSSKAATKFIKDLEKVACAKSGPGCSVYYSASAPLNEFGAAKFTVEVVQPVDTTVELVDMEAVIKADDFKETFGSSELGYDLNIKKVYLVDVQVAADMTMTIMEVTPEGMKPGTAMMVMKALKAEEAVAPAKFAAMLKMPVTDLMLFEATMETMTKDVECEPECYKMRRSAEAQRKLLFGNLMCKPECLLPKGMGFMK